MQGIIVLLGKIRYLNIMKSLGPIIKSDDIFSFAYLYIVYFFSDIMGPFGMIYY